jgi:4,5-dihydroxyphthalate decarboxylase
MALLPLTFACGGYDRVWPLVDGRVRAEGVELNMITLEPEECFWRMLRFAEFDVAEMSLGSYCMLRARQDERFVAIPVFLSRSFRHSSVYVRADAGIDDPTALAGRRVGVPEYQMTASVWTRGMLADDHGVDLDSITWCTGGLEQPGRVERQALEVPGRVRIEPVAPDTTLSDQLLEGRLDALMAPRVPSAFRRGDPRVRRLFPDYAERELEYYRRTGTFPIMHVVVIRADVAHEHPWLPQSLYKALRQAKQCALAGIVEAPALRYTMPFLLDALERQESVFGDDPWPYGLEANRSQLQTFVRYLREQGIVEHAVDVDDLFAASTLVESRI